MIGRWELVFRAMSGLAIWGSVTGGGVGWAGDAMEAIAKTAAGAPLAVVGQPLRRESRWENGGVWTHTEVAVRSAIGAAVPDTILVRERGGEVDGIGQRVSHVRMIDPTRPHLLLLWRDPETGEWQTGLGGVLPIIVTPNGEESVEGLSLTSVLAALGWIIR